MGATAAAHAGRTAGRQQQQQQQQPPAAWQQWGSNPAPQEPPQQQQAPQQQRPPRRPRAPPSRRRSPEPEWLEAPEKLLKGPPPPRAAPGARNDNVALAPPTVPEGALEAGPVPLFPCESCGRKFNEKALARHARSCAKAQAKRKAFDAAKNRQAEGATMAAQRLDAERRAFKGRSYGEERAVPAKKVPKWKQQSEQLRRATGAPPAASSSSGGGGGGGGGAPAEPYVDPSYVQCPNCQRRFNEHAAERHIPQCKNILARPKRLMRKQQRYGNAR